MNPRVVIAGGTGFLGRALVQEFCRHGYDIVCLTRSGHSVPHTRTVSWDGQSVGMWAEELKGATAVINLSGEPLLQRWTAEARHRLVASRTESSAAIEHAITASDHPPKVWVNASAVGYYGNQGDEMLTEEFGPGSDFLAQLCEAWESIIANSPLLHTRRVWMRIGMVFGKGGGSLAAMTKAVRMFVGGAMGNGRQWTPWIHQADLVGLFRFAVETTRVQGPVNAVSPNPVRNAELMAALRKLHRRPWAPAAPPFALNLAARVMGIPPAPLLASIRAVPTKATDLGYEFHFPDLETALRDLARH